MASQSVYYIPNGPKNLVSLFPVVQFGDVAEYFVQVLDSIEDIVASTPVNNIYACSADEKVRIHFLNYLGTYDAINFKKPTIEHEDTDSTYQAALNYPLNKTDTGIERFNVTSNDTYEARLKCLEPDMPWLMECQDSPKAFMEWLGTEGQPDNYIPVVIITAKGVKLKNDKEFDYEFVLQFKLSNEFITIRN
jgi:hypothetical protein